VRDKSGRRGEKEEKKKGGGKGGKEKKEKRKRSSSLSRIGLHFLLNRFGRPTVRKDAVEERKRLTPLFQLFFSCPKAFSHDARGKRKEGEKRGEKEGRRKKGGERKGEASRRLSFPRPSRPPTLVVSGMNGGERKKKEEKRVSPIDFSYLPACG